MLEILGRALSKSAITEPASISLAGLVLVGAAIVITAPLWPALDLDKVGLMIFVVGCSFSFLFAFTAVYDDIQDRKAERRPSRKMFKRFQNMRKNNQA